MDLRAQTESLTARLAKLEAETAVLDVLYRYAQGIDYGDREDWLDCFVENGVMVMQRRGPEAQDASIGEGDVHEDGMRYASPAALGNFFETFSATPTMGQKHILEVPRVDVAEDGKSATVKSYFAVLFDQDGQRGIRSFGRYLDELVNCPDGKWRFEHRLIEVETTPADKG